MEKKIKILKVATILSGMLACVPIIFDRIQLIFLKYLLKKDLCPNDASAIGIIGSADGPTAIFVSSGNRTGIYIFTGVFTILTAVGIVGCLKLKNIFGKNV